MFDYILVYCLIGIALFFGVIGFGCWWDLNGYKIKERRRLARQKLIDAALAEAEKRAAAEEAFKAAGKRA